MNIGDVELDEGPVVITLCPTCRRRTTRTRSSSCRPCELGPLQYKSSPDPSGLAVDVMDAVRQLRQTPQL